MARRRVHRAARGLPALGGGIPRRVAPLGEPASRRRLRRRDRQSALGPASKQQGSGMVCHYGTASNRPRSPVPPPPAKPPSSNSATNPPIRLPLPRQRVRPPRPRRARLGMTVIRLPLPRRERAGVRVPRDRPLVLARPPSPSKGEDWGEGDPAGNLVADYDAAIRTRGKPGSPDPRLLPLPPARRRRHQPLFAVRGAGHKLGQARRLRGPAHAVGHLRRQDRRRLLQDRLHQRARRRPVRFRESPPRHRPAALLSEDRFTPLSSSARSSSAAPSARSTRPSAPSSCTTPQPSTTRTAASRFPPTTSPA